MLSLMQRNIALNDLTRKVTAVVYDWDAEAAKLRHLAARGARRREAQVQAPTEH